MQEFLMLKLISRLEKCGFVLNDAYFGAQAVK